MGTKTHTSAVYVVFPLEYRLIPTLLDLPPQSAFKFAHPKYPLYLPFCEVTKVYKCLSGALSAISPMVFQIDRSAEDRFLEVLEYLLKMTKQLLVLIK